MVIFSLCRSAVGYMGLFSDTPLLSGIYFDFLKFPPFGGNLQSLWGKIFGLCFGSFLIIFAVFVITPSHQRKNSRGVRFSVVCNEIFSKSQFLITENRVPVRGQNPLTAFPRLKFFLRKITDFPNFSRKIARKILNLGNVVSGSVRLKRNRVVTFGASKSDFLGFPTTSQGTYEFSYVPREAVDFLKVYV